MERRKFTREFKLEAVKLIEERGVTVVQAARDLGVQGTVLRRCVQECVADAQQVCFLGRRQARTSHMSHHDHPPTPLYPRGCCVDRLNLPPSRLLLLRRSLN
jgi:hypothetical protein